MNLSPVRLVRLLGTVAVLAGAIVIVYNYDQVSYENGYFVGALLVLGGLLLRIEGAVRAGTDAGTDPGMPGDRPGS